MRYGSRLTVYLGPIGALLVRDALAFGALAIVRRVSVAVLVLVKGNEARKPRAVVGSV